jgi:hypothetical protein
MTVPYAAIADDIRNNSGFEDLRGRPDKASAIAEGNASPALRRLLVRIANVGSTIFTLGCELGSHQEPTHVPMRRREVAGGYVQFAIIHYNRIRCCLSLRCIEAHRAASAAFMTVGNGAPGRLTGD